LIILFLAVPGSKRGEMEREDYCNEKKALTVLPKCSTLAALFLPA
jgi:hypothetical protein